MGQLIDARSRFAARSVGFTDPLKAAEAIDRLVQIWGRKADEQRKQFENVARVDGGEKR